MRAHNRRANGDGDGDDGSDGGSDAAGLGDDDEDDDDGSETEWEGMESDGDDDEQFVSRAEARLKQGMRSSLYPHQLKAFRWLVGLERAATSSGGHAIPGNCRCVLMWATTARSKRSAALGSRQFGAQLRICHGAKSALEPHPKESATLAEATPTRHSE